MQRKRKTGEVVELTLLRQRLDDAHKQINLLEDDAAKRSQILNDLIVKANLIVAENKQLRQHVCELQRVVVALSGILEHTQPDLRKDRDVPLIASHAALARTYNEYVDLDSGFKSDSDPVRHGR